MKPAGLCGRVLSRYPVHAWSANPAAVGLQSRYAFSSHIHPAYGDESFLPWLCDCRQKQEIEAIVPSEGFLLAIHGAVAEFADVLPGLPDEPTVDNGSIKARVAEILQSSKANAFLPPSCVIDSQRKPVGPEELAHFARPFFVKTDAVLAKRDGDSQVLRRQGYALSARNDHGQSFLSENQPDKGADRDLPRRFRANSCRDALCATIISNPSGPFGESQSISFRS